MPSGVVVTGIGVIAGPDCGTQALMATLQSTRMKTAAVDDRQGYHVPGAARRALLSKGIDLTKWLSPAAARRMSPPSRLAVAAARMALQQARLMDGGGPAGAVVLSSSFGPVTSTEDLLATARRDGPQAVSPFSFAESVANAAAGQVAIATKAQGPNLTILQRESGPLTAIGRAAALIEDGRADYALAGCVDEMTPLLHAVMGRFDALVRPGPEGCEVARPFDANRSGFVAAEGATVLFLERDRAATARGARVLARIRGFGSAFDSSAPRIGWGRGGAALARQVLRTLADAGCAPADIARIVSGACGAVDGDRLEADVLKAVWSSSAMPIVLAPKGHVGQYGGGFLAAAFLSVAGGPAAPTAGFVHDDPCLGIRPFSGGLLDPAPLSLFTTMGSGGHASWLIVEAA